MPRGRPQKFPDHTLVNRSIKMPSDLSDALQAIADAAGVTWSDVARSAIASTITSRGGSIESLAVGNDVFELVRENA